MCRSPFNVPVDISTHALREEGDRDRQHHGPPHRISTHALREEGDFATANLRNRISYFYPRPPRGGRPLAADTPLQAPVFLPTPSARRATCSIRWAVHFYRISTHALREEGDCSSPHRQHSPQHFYPRPPRGGRRYNLFHKLTPSIISTHALREEGDRGVPVP